MFQMFTLRQILQFVQPKDCLASVDFQNVCMCVVLCIFLEDPHRHVCMYIFVCLLVGVQNAGFKFFFFVWPYSSLQQCRFLTLFCFCKNTSLHISEKMAVKWLHMWESKLAFSKDSHQHWVKSVCTEIQ